MVGLSASSIDLLQTLEWRSVMASRLLPHLVFLAYLHLYIFSKGFWAGVSLDTHSDDLLQALEVAIDRARSYFLLGLSGLPPLT